jgi:hypothetical protein
MAKTWLICSTHAKDSHNANTMTSISKILVHIIMLCKILRKIFLLTVMIANIEWEVFHYKIIIKISLCISNLRMNSLEVSCSLKGNSMNICRIIIFKMKRENLRLLGLLTIKVIKIITRAFKRSIEIEIILLMSIKFNRKIKYVSLQSLILIHSRILQYKIKEQQ